MAIPQRSGPIAPPKGRGMHGVACFALCRAFPLRSDNIILQTPNLRPHTWFGDGSAVLQSLEIDTKTKTALSPLPSQSTFQLLVLRRLARTSPGRHPRRRRRSRARGSIRTGSCSTFQGGPFNTRTTDSNQLLASGTYINTGDRMVEINRPRFCARPSRGSIARWSPPTSSIAPPIPGRSSRSHVAAKRLTAAIDRDQTSASRGSFSLGNAR